MSNQDSIALQQAYTHYGRLFMATVSDGIGGLSEGENASGYICEKLIENFHRQLLPLAERGKGIKAFQRNLLRVFYEMRQNLARYGTERDIDLGATVSLLLLWKGKYLILHIGDSRIYLYRKNKRNVLTVDHRDKYGRLTKCMGSFPFQVPYMRVGKAHGKSGFLLCTDGFYRKQSEESMGLLEPVQIDEEQQIDGRLGEMARWGMKRGEKDNMSAVYVKVCGWGQTRRRRA